jgi:putative ABC transport system permease protein
VRKALVVFQFVISAGLIIGTLVVYHQLQFVRDKNLGFDKEQVVMVNMFRSNLAARYDDLKARLLTHRDVRYVTTAEDVLGSKCQTNPFKPEGATEFAQFQRLMVGYDFVEAMNLELVAGRGFQKEFVTDDSLAVLINESMVKHLDWGTPEEALGKGLAGQRRTQRVIGVMKDFHYSSLHAPIGPFVLDIADTERQHNFFDRYLSIRIAPHNYRATLDHIKGVWAEFMPDRPFEFFFMDEALNNLYRAEHRLTQVAGLFTAFALIVACIGLLGIAMFVVETKTKEISIRKVLGASVAQIMYLLSRDFLKPVLVANLIAFPVAWYLLDQWLDHFAYRAQFQWWFFVAAAALSLAIALITVSVQVIRSANINPAPVLKGE